MNGLGNEILRLSIASFVRHALMAIGAALAALGWVESDKFDSWAAAHYGEMVGWILMGITLAWSWLQKQDVLKLLRAAIQSDPQQPDGSPTQVAHVRQQVKRQDATARRARPLTLCLMLFLLVIPQAACGDGSVRAFLSASYRIVKATDLIRKQVNELHDSQPNVLSTEKTLSTLRLLRTVITARMEVGNIFKAHIKTDANGKQTLVLTLKGKAEMEASVAQMRGGIDGLAAGDLPSPDQIAINRQVIGLQPVMDSFAKVVAKLKVDEKADLNSVQVMALARVADQIISGDKLALAELAQVEVMACNLN